MGKNFHPHFSLFTATKNGEGVNKGINEDVDVKDGDTEGVIVPIVVPVIAVVLVITLGAICYARRIRIRMQSSNVSTNTRERVIDELKIFCGNVYLKVMDECLV